MRIFYALIICIFFRCNIIAQHRPLYSAYMLNPVLVNPAFAGNEGALSVAAVSRVQWLGISGGPITNTAIGHTPLVFRPMAVGAVVSYDKFGPQSLFYGTAMASCKIRLGKFRVVGAMQAGYNNMQLNFTSDNPQAIANAMNDPAYATLATHQYTLGAGVIIIYKNFFIGASIPYVSMQSGTNQEANGWLYSQQNLFTGANFEVSENVLLRPSVLLKNVKGSNLQADVNMLVTLFDKFTPGISYRVNNAIVGILMMNVNPQLSFGYSYDYVTSPLTNYTSGNHEIQVKYTFKYYVSELNVRKFK